MSNENNKQETLSNFDRLEDMYKMAAELTKKNKELGRSVGNLVHALSIKHSEVNLEIDDLYRTLNALCKI